MKKLLAVMLFMLTIVSTCLFMSGCTSTEALYDNDLVKNIKREGDVYNVTLNKKEYVDTLVLSEKADKVTNFGVYGKNEEGKFDLIYQSDRIDTYRLCALDGMVTDELRIEIFSKLGKTKINSIKAFNSTAQKSSSDFRVSEYLTTDKKKLEQNKDNPEFYQYFKNIDDIILIGEIGIDQDGNIAYGEGKEDFAEDIKCLQEIKIKAQNYNMNVIVSVGLRGLSGENVTNKGIKEGANKYLDKIANNIAQFAEEFEIAGIDFDWEYPENSSQWKAYSDLIVSVGNVLSKSNRYVTVALPHWGINLSEQAVSAIKYVNLMTYDIFDERGEHASFYVTTKAGIDKILRETTFKKEQLYLGLSFYGRTINKSANAWPDMNWDYTYNGKSLGKWNNYIKNFEYEEDGLQKVCDAYINGYAMNRDKTIYALASGLGGVMIFRMSCDAPASYEYCLHNAVWEGLERGLNR